MWLPEFDRKSQKFRQFGVFTKFLSLFQKRHSVNTVLRIAIWVGPRLKTVCIFQVSKPNEAVIRNASSVLEAALQTCDKVSYVKKAIDSIIKLVNDLLNVSKCNHSSICKNLLDDTDRIRDISPTRLMEQVPIFKIKSLNGGVVASIFWELNYFA